MINKMKERKAQGPDHLKAEALMFADRGTKIEIRRQINEILLGKIPPEEWGESLIYPIYKKGDPRDPGNYRGIAIGNAALWCRSQIRRLKPFFTPSWIYLIFRTLVIR